MKGTELLMNFLCGYIILNQNEDGNTTIDCTSLAIQLGVKKNQVEYALASLILDKFCNPFANDLQSFCTVTLYDTRGYEVSVANKLQRFCKVIAHLDWTYENLKKSDNETLENNNFRGATNNSSEESSVYNIYNISSNNILQEENNNRGMGEEEKEEVGKIENADYEKVVELYNTLVADRTPWPRCTSLTKQRKSGIKNRLAWLRKNFPESKYPNTTPMDMMQRVCQLVYESDFLTGRSRENKINASFNFNWIFCSEENFVKITEGTYKNKEEKQPQPATSKQQWVQQQDDEARRWSEYLTRCAEIEEANRKASEEKSRRDQEEWERRGMPLSEDIARCYQLTERLYKWDRPENQINTEGLNEQEIEMVVRSQDSLLASIKTEIVEIYNRGRARAGLEPLTDIPGTLFSDMKFE